MEKEFKKLIEYLRIEREACRQNVDKLKTGKACWMNKGAFSMINKTLEKIEIICDGD